MIEVLILAQESVIEIANSPGIVEVLQLLALPVILASIPYLFSRTKRTAEKTAEVARSINPESNSEGPSKPVMYGMVEETLLTLGEIRGDIKDLASTQVDQGIEVKRLRVEFEDHMADDQAFAETTSKTLGEVTSSLSHIEDTLTSPAQTPTP